MKRAKLVLPLVLAVLIGCYAALGVWISGSSQTLPHGLTDQTGDRAALDPFPLTLTLQTELLKQDLHIQDGVVSAQVRYDRSADSTDTPLLDIDPLSAGTPLLEVTADAHTSTQPGFLPTISFPQPDHAPDGYICSTDRAKIYLTASLSAAAVQARAAARQGDGAPPAEGQICIDSGLYLESPSASIAIGYYSENVTITPPTLSGGEAVTERQTNLYGVTVGPARFSKTDYSSFSCPVRSVQCAGYTFFVPTPESEMLYNDWGDVTVTGTRSLFRVTEAEPIVDMNNGSTPDAVRTYGAAQTLLSFPAADSTLLLLENIGDTYVAAGFQVGNELQFYLLRPDGSLVDSLALPIARTNDMPQTLVWETDWCYQNTDANGVPYLTGSFTGARVSHLEDGSLHEIFAVETVALRLDGGLQCMIQMSQESFPQVVLAAWREGRLLLVRQDWDNSTLPSLDGRPGHLSGDNMTLSLSVYGADGEMLYSVTLQTLLSGQSFRTSYPFSFAQAVLTGT